LWNQHDNKKKDSNEHRNASRTFLRSETGIVACKPEVANPIALLITAQRESAFPLHAVSAAVREQGWGNFDHVA